MASTSSSAPSPGDRPVHVRAVDALGGVDGGRAERGGRRLDASVDEIRCHGDVAGEEVFIQAAHLRVRRGVVCVRLLLPAGG